MAPHFLPPDAELRDYLSSFDMFEQLGRPQEGQEYLDYHLVRVRKTVELLPKLTGNIEVLELGASPYFMTFLIQKYLGYRVSTANFFGDYRSPTGGTETTIINSQRYQESHEYTYPLFNLETDLYPFADKSFDIVLSCEILEHLVMNPSWMLAEIHRILKPGGYLLLTTPNIASLKNALLLLNGKNFQHAYSGYGVYGRHNREFTPSELLDLLELHRFDVEIIVDDVYPSPAWMQFLTQFGSFQSYRDNLFALCQAQPEPSYPRYPGWLYSHLWGSANRAITSAIAMGQGEEIQLGEGWHALENEPPHFRWTQDNALVSLRVPPTASYWVMEASSGGRDATVQIWQDLILIAEFELSHRQTIKLALPPAILEQVREQEQILTFKISTLNSFQPSEISDSPDDRRLGIVVYALKIA